MWFMNLHFLQTNLLILDMFIQPFIEKKYYISTLRLPEKSRNTVCQILLWVEFSFFFLFFEFLTYEVCLCFLYILKQLGRKKLQNSD